LQERTARKLCPG